MSYEFFYPGTTYSLEPTYGDIFTGYRIPAANIGLSTDPRTANQIQEVSNKMNTGGAAVEVSAISPQVFESIPDKHLEEIKRLTKLTGTEVSVHGPAIEPSGYTEDGKWSETSRQFAENQIMTAVERTNKLDPKGNINVTFHPAYVLPEGEVRIKEKGKEVPKSRVLFVDTTTGEVGQVKETERFFPEAIPEKYRERIEKKEFVPEWEIEKRNREAWDNVLNQLNYYALRGSDLIDNSLRAFGKTEEALEGKPAEEKEKIQEDILKAYSIKDREKILQKFPEQEREMITDVFRNFDHGSIMLRSSYNELRELYNRVYKDATPEDRKKLDSYASHIKGYIAAGIEKNPEKLKKFSEVIEDGVKVLSSISSPKLYQPLNQFLIEKDSETFSNVALNAYEKFGDKSPVISIENPPAGAALSRADEIKSLIEETRKKFIEKARKRGISEEEAKKAAEKLVGATWDVGHINMLRKYGYDKADIVKETGKIAPFIKHVHLSDNFGGEHTELPMGMGNVPIKEIMEKLGKEGEKVKKIIEAGNWYQFFKTTPLAESYEALGTPLFPMKAPYWNQMPAYGNYFAFPSAFFPEQHFSIYGSGFSQLPAELGGQIPGKQQRLTGTPME